MIKRFIKSLLPQSVIRWRHHQIAKRRRVEFQGLSTQQVFTKIYTDRVWGAAGDRERPFFSGTGSCEGPIVERYVAAVSEFLLSLPTKPDVVDLGCGDFYVGSQLRSHCNRYIACDIVPPLIEFNRKKFQRLDVDFRVLDLSQDPLPSGEILFIRQVLQHLSNADIAAVLPQLANYRYTVVTEHVPANPTFVPNLDKQASFDIRLDFGSGIVLTSPPFNLASKGQRVLCEATESNGIIRTTLYTMN